MTITQERSQTTVAAQLEVARAELATLQEELPQFHGLLTRNEQDAERLKQERADPTKRAEAIQRVSVARELLEQHQHDIQTAKAEVQRLEQSLKREQATESLAKLAKSAEARQAKIQKMLDQAHATLEQQLGRIRGEWSELIADRTTFMNEARELSRLFGLTGLPNSMSLESEAEERTKAEALLSELRARGVDTSAVLTPHDGLRLSVMDSHVPSIKAPERFGHLLMSGLAAELNAHRDLLQVELRERDRRRLEATQQKQGPFG